MSRLSTLSPEALKMMFASESSDTFVTLITISSDELDDDIRITDNYTQRLSETDTDIIYGVISNGLAYTFLPIQVTLPTEEAGTSPRANLTMHDVTHIVLPYIRQLVTAPNVKLEIVLKSAPDVVEIDFDGFKLSGISYNASSIMGELNVENTAIEPFPQHTFTPSNFPSLF